MTSACPENASSICPFSSPVAFHWVMNSRCERLAIRPVSSTEIGTLTSAMTASSGEMITIMVSTATTVSSEISIWLIDCCSVWVTLSMSLVTRLSTSPRGWPSK